MVPVAAVALTVIVSIGDVRMGRVMLGSVAATRLVLAPAHSTYAPDEPLKTGVLLMGMAMVLAPSVLVPAPVAVTLIVEEEPVAERVIVVPFVMVAA
jgi:hypothetical protein